MKKLWLCVISVCLLSCSFISLESVNTSYDINEIWDNTIKEYLLDEQWTSDYIYDAGHALLIPMVASFKLNNKEWKNQFYNFFERYLTEYKKDENGIDKSTLNYTQFLFLISNYVALANDYEESDELINNLELMLYDELLRIWNEPAWIWDHPDFENMGERLKWKLDTKNVERSYYRVIFDVDWYMFGIAANLCSDSKYKEEKAIQDILDLAYRYFYQESIFTASDGWLIQQGVWSDHPDYAYAGNTEKNENIERLPVYNLAWDSSHFHRMPAILRSLRSAHASDTEEYQFYDKLIHSLANQFMNEVYVEPNNQFNGVRLTNFMDGWNGIYRWNYATTAKENDGIGPYENSGTYLFGWWAFLEDERITNTYSQMAEFFPLDDNVIKTYVGPNTTRNRHEMVAQPNLYENGYSELICRLVPEIYGN